MRCLREVSKVRYLPGLWGGSHGEIFAWFVGRNPR